MARDAASAAARSGARDRYAPAHDSAELHPARINPAAAIRGSLAQDGVRLLIARNGSAGCGGGKTRRVRRRSSRKWEPWRAWLKAQRKRSRSAELFPLIPALRFLRKITLLGKNRVVERNQPRPYPSQRERPNHQSHWKFVVVQRRRIRQHPVHLHHRDAHLDRQQQPGSPCEQSNDEQYPAKELKHPCDVSKIRRKTHTSEGLGCVLQLREQLGVPMRDKNDPKSHPQQQQRERLQFFQTFHS